VVVFVGLERRVFHGMKDFSLCARGIFFWGGGGGGYDTTGWEGGVQQLGWF